MAQRRAQLDIETPSCSICLDALKDPCSVPCGHSFCYSCISHFWARPDPRETYSCPQCRKSFSPRPYLAKTKAVEELEMSGLQAAPADHCYAGAEDVACDVCTGKALKSCLVCLVSYCSTHLQPHYLVARFKKHQLIEPSKDLQENICPHHDKLMEVFCRSDQQCICHLCCLDQHKGHNIVSAAAERREKQEKLQESQQSIQQRIQVREDDVKVLQLEVKHINISADESVEHSQKIYTQLIRLMEKRSSEVKQQIRSQQEAEVRRVKELKKKLEQEITELRSKAAELQQLSHTENDCHFLHNYSSASHLPGSTHSSRIHIRPRRYFEDVTAAVSESSQIIQQLLRDTWTNISWAVAHVDALLSPKELKTRAEFLRYSCDVTLDPNTAHLSLLLSEGNRRATVMRNDQAYAQHPERFTYYTQVLSRASLTGRSYWEVKFRGEVRVAVAHENIGRARYDSLFGGNDKSWAVHCDHQGFRFWSNSVESSISAPPSSTVGVYLDRPAGLLSFYSVSDTMTLLHRVQTSFTQPLLAGLWVCGSWAEFCKLSATL